MKRLLVPRLINWRKDVSSLLWIWKLPPVLEENFSIAVFHAKSKRSRNIVRIAVRNIERVVWCLANAVNKGSDRKKKRAKNNNTGSYFKTFDRFSEATSGPDKFLVHFFARDQIDPTFQFVHYSNPLQRKEAFVCKMPGWKFLFPRNLFFEDQKRNLNFSHVRKTS